MKKLLITIPFLFLAAACNQQPPVSSLPSQQSAVASATPAMQTQTQATPTPTGTTGTMSGWTAYQNTAYGYEVSFPYDSILTTYDVNLGAAGNKIVKSFPSNSAGINIAQIRAFVNICAESNCSSLGGLSTSDVATNEQVTIKNGTQLKASGFINQDGTSKAMQITISGLEIKYGYSSPNPLSQSERDAANKFDSQVISTLQLTK